MALAVESRPGGYIIEGFNDIRVVSSDVIVGGTDNRAMVFLSTHGLSNGAVFYVRSNVIDYNGFVKILTYGPDYFYIIENETNGDYIQFIKNATGEGGTPTTFGFGHMWNCVHLPIVYKISNTKWPLNTEDTTRTMSSVTDSNGYCNITASGDIKSTGSAAKLEFVKISGATVDTLNGVWQIITYSSDTSFVLNIPYSSANDTALTGASIQYYYNNYVTKVQVWGGLNNGHEYYAQKPYELLATLDLIPDSNNDCKFSISEILKKQIEIENNLLLGTLPNNLDAWTSFFIKYGEEHDDSDGSTLSRSTVTYTNDLSSFEGYASNSALPFKNIYSGSMSEYVGGSEDEKFLTNWVQPTLFTEYYFDLSFIFDNYLGPLDFENDQFTDNLTNWTTITLPSTAAWVWNIGGTTTASSLNPNTGAIGQDGPGAHGWPAGDYRITIRARNDSLGGSAPFYSYAFLYAGDSATDIQDNIQFNETTGFWSVGAGYINRQLSFSLPASVPYLFLTFDKAGPSGGYQVSITLDSITIDESPEYDSTIPVIKEEYYNVSDTLQDTTYTDLGDTANTGVTRAPLTVADTICDYPRVDATILKGQINYLQSPISWTDLSAWTAKTATQFTYVDAASPYTGSQSYIDISVTSGDVYELTIPVALSGTYNGSIQIDVVITDASNVSISNFATITITTAEASDTINAELVVTSTNANARLHVLTTISVGTGSIDLALTMPQEYVLIPAVSEITETKTINIDCNCVPTQAEDGIYLSWLNNLGGFDQWLFTAYKDHLLDVVDTGETNVNILPSWPQSYGEFADTRRKQTFRESFKKLLVRSQNLTKDDVDMISYIKSSSLVQIVNSIYDRRTVIVDNESFVVYKEESKTYEISFTITYTDDVPSQRV